jgi:hypothetical protein
LGVFLPFNYIVQMALRNGMSASLANYLVSIISALKVTNILPLFSLFQQIQKANVCNFLVFSDARSLVI